jgi:DNA-directed RNA polymerase subunit RPC12/RpoP
MPDAGFLLRTEYCCPQCLASVYASTSDRPPHCARCGIAMLADSDEPQPRQFGPRQRRSIGRPAKLRVEPADA